MFYGFGPAHCGFIQSNVEAAVLYAGFERGRWAPPFYFLDFQRRVSSIVLSPGRGFYIGKLFLYTRTMSFLQYLKDTRGELNHVAWPTRMQTIVYTILVIALSILVALYLGFFDYVFTTGLARAVEFLTQNTAPAFAPETTIPTTTPSL